MTIAEAGKKAKSLMLVPEFRSQALEKECMKYKLLLAQPTAPKQQHSHLCNLYNFCACHLE